MKVLILTGSTGGGHNKTANNIHKLCLDNNIESHIFDILDNEKEIGEIKKDISAKESLYDKIIKYVPDMYRLVYYLSNNDLVKLLNRLVRENSENLYAKINEYKPDVIVSAHPMSVALIKRFYRKEYEMNIPYIQVVTDFHAHKVYMDNIVDAYITPCEYTNFDIAKNGIKLSKTFDYGIPISDKFKNIGPKKELTNEIMIMLGSMGFSDKIEEIYHLLDNNNSQKFYFITGKNKELKEKLEDKYKEKIEQNKLEVFGFIDNVDEIMKKVDLIITKPGGLSLTECINMKKPMILVNPIPGQEEENLKIIEMYGIGKNGTKIDLPIYNIVEELYNNPKEFDDMLEGLNRLSRNYSSEKIVELIKNIKKIDKYNK